MKKVAIILNTPSLSRLPKDEDIIICADGGAKYVDSPDYLLGDMDSLNVQNNAKNTIILPTHKDVSDGEFAVRFAVEKLHPDEIHIYGIAGGRVDHILGNLSLLALANDLGCVAYGHDDKQDIYFTSATLSFKAKINDTISIVPFSGDAVVSATGLEYPLNKLTLPIKTTLGISNVAFEEDINISVLSGCVFVFHCL